jgi:hypothetical protein
MSSNPILRDTLGGEYYPAQPVTYGIWAIFSAWYNHCAQKNLPVTLTNSVSLAFYAETS